MRCCDADDIRSYRTISTTAASPAGVRGPHDAVGGSAASGLLYLRRGVRRRDRKSVSVLRQHDSGRCPLARCRRRRLERSQQRTSPFQAGTVLAPLTPPDHEASVYARRTICRVRSVASSAAKADRRRRGVARQWSAPDADRHRLHRPRLRRDHSPGVGKTRLALEIAWRRLTAMGDGVHVVELAPVADANLVSATVASAFGLAEGSGRSLVDVLHARHLLRVLDNCEHGEFRGDEAALLRAVREHGATRHQLTLSDEQILAVARPVTPPERRAEN